MKQYAINNDKNDRNNQIDVTKLNRARMMQQNKRLIAEIHKLDHVISSIIEKNVSNDYQFIEEAQGLKKKYHLDQERQLRQIYRLKKEIKRIKTNLVENKFDDVKDQENQLTYLRKQYDKLMREKQTLLKKKGQKEEALEFQKPLNHQTAATFDKYRKVKSENADLKLMINEKEKEINKYHKIRELSKSSAPKDLQNPNYQFLKMENEIQKMRREMKKVEQKWKHKLDVLDRQYFGFRNILTDKQQWIENLEKEAKNWESKSSHYRDKSAIESDRLRVNSVVISPKKRKEMQILLEQAKRSKRRPSPQPFQFKNKLDQKKIDKEKAIETVKQPGFSIPEAFDKSAAKQEVQIPPKQKQLEEEVAPVAAPIEEPKSPNKAFENVGVGTSFYYAED